MSDDQPAMSVYERLVGLLLTAERSSAEGAVTIDLFPRGEAGAGGDGLDPLWDAPAPIGRLVAERGRVCWVMAKGCDATVSDLLAVETGIPSAQLEQVYQAAKKDGAPFGETLAETGLVSADDVRGALRRQAATAVVTLAQLQARDAVTVSVAHIPRLSYDERFTFHTLDMLAAALSDSAVLREELGQLPATYVTMAPRLQGALYFREFPDSDQPLLPVACDARRDLSMGAALELAMTALAVTQPADALLAEIAPFALLPGDEGAWWLCAYLHPHLSLYQVHTRAEYLELLGNLLAESKG